MIINDEINTSIIANEIQIAYKIIRQKRKTISMRINSEFEVVVKAPLNMSDAEINVFIEKHKEWVKETLHKKLIIRNENDWILTKRIMYLGKYKTVEISVVPYAKEVVILKGQEGIKMITCGDEDKMRKSMENFFREKAKKLFVQLADYYADKVGVSYEKITIRKQETRWGSCSQNGNLSFNVKLMCAPKEMIEYVVLHEVMHLRHFNHSKAFWKDIEEIMPDYKEKMNYFNQFGQNFII